MASQNSQECLTRSCSFDSSFEQILMPSKWRFAGDEIAEGKKEEPLNRECFDKLLDPDGRLVDEHSFRKAVFRGKLT